MKATYIDYSDTNSFSNTLLAYLSGEQNLSPFYGNRPDYSGFKDQLSKKQNFAHRRLLTKILKQQYGDLLETSPEVAKQIALLGDEKTFTVTTGHQLNIFTGPLYFIFKIVTAIRLAKDLKDQFADHEFVPVYWMASEDHDFEEINHTRVYGKKITWERESGAATGRMDTATMEQVVKQYCNTFGLSENASTLTRLVKHAYLEGRNLADATRVFVNSLFGEFGLVIIDADHPELKKQFAPIMKEDILHERSFEAITKTTTSLINANYGSQINPREINFFYLTDDFRERIVRNEDGRFEVLHQDLFFTQAALEKEIATHPERFSPNVVMRPLYQEVILPNLCYIGGGAEIVYWLQLKANFDQYNTVFPILVPRNSAMITEDQVVGKIFRLDLTFKSIFKPTITLKNEYVRRSTKHRLNLQDEWMEFNAIFAKIKLRTHKIDPSLAPSAEAVKARLKKAINNLEKKLLKAEKHNYEEALIQIERVKDKLFPQGGLQERSENFAVLYLKHGDRFIPDLIDSFNPLDFKFTILY